MKNIAKEGGCGAWCCEHQTPSLFYSEFLYAWNRVENSWPKDRKIKLILRSVEAYFSSKPTKGCIFWDRETKFCTIHETRPYNCRTYGQIPDEEFKPRVHRLKVLYADNPEAVIRDQCDLVTSPKPPTKKELDDWFAELTFIEGDIGIPKSLMNDGDGGSYRQFHDHVLLKTCSDELLYHMSELRASGSDNDKKAFINQLEKDLEKGL